MEISMKELSKLAGVSARTLRYYDEIGLLKPTRKSESGYRFYEEHEIAQLQQILFYKERGLELKVIRKIIHDKDFDMMKAMEEHLLELEKKKVDTEALILTVRKTIQNMKGKCEMSNSEKFQAFKDRMVAENEKKYGEEIRHKYGDAQVEASNKKWLNLSGEQWERWQELDQTILKKLESAVQSDVGTDNKETKEIAELHKEWLLLSVPKYSREMHQGIAAMYIADERFTKYYDRNVQGCAELLNAVIKKWI